MRINGNQSGEIINSIHYVDFERRMVCLEHRENCKECEYYKDVSVNNKRYGKRCELIITHNTLCKILAKYTPEPMEFMEKDDDPRT